MSGKLLLLLLAAGAGSPRVAQAQEPPPPVAQPLPPGSPVPVGGPYAPPPQVTVAPPPSGYYQPAPQYITVPPEVQFRQRMRYASIARGLRAGGGVMLAFGIFSLMAGGIVYGLSAGEVICNPPGKPCEPPLNASYGLFAAGGILTTGGITMIVFGTVYRFKAMFAQAGPSTATGWNL